MVEAGIAAVFRFVTGLCGDFSFNPGGSMIEVNDEQLKEYCHLTDDMFGDEGGFDNYDDYVDHYDDLLGSSDRAGEPPLVDRQLFKKLQVVDIDITYFAEYQFCNVPEHMMFDLGFALVKLTTMAIANGQVLYCKNDSDKGYALVVGYLPTQLTITSEPKKAKKAKA